jgi:hypothetical protein
VEDPSLGRLGVDCEDAEPSRTERTGKLARTAPHLKHSRWRPRKRTVNEGREIQFDSASLAMPEAKPAYPHRPLSKMRCSRPQPSAEWTFAGDEALTAAFLVPFFYLVSQKSGNNLVPQATNSRPNPVRMQLFSRLPGLDSNQQPSG